MARTLTGLTPRQEQHRQERILDTITARYQRRIANEIARAMRKATRDLATPALHQAEHVERMTTLLVRLWRESGRDMAGHVDGRVKSRPGLQTKKDGPALEPTEVADQIMRSWITTQGGVEITNITASTLRDVQNQIDAGIADGLSEKQIAAKIRAYAPVIAGSRSQTIARTETHAAANVAAQATAQASGVSLVREWVASKGERTRQTHRDADGQRVQMDEPFTVGGVSLRYPGDQQAGHPAETINCRCAVAYVLDRRL